MKRFITIILISFLLLSQRVSNVSAQDYSFQVPRQEVTVFLNSDGTASIEYVIEFKNNTGADAIDYVDIGMPNGSYDIKSITAEINGKKITDIERSPYVNPGVALGLGSNAIPASGSGTVHVFIGKVQGMLFPGTEKEAESYASFQFMPNYFGSEFVSGTTNMTVTLVLPPGLTEQEPRFYPPKGWPGEAGPETAYDNNDRVFYRWTATNANAHTKYIFGGAFPARLVPESAISTPPPVSLNIKSDDICCAGFFMLFFGIFGLSIYSATIGARKRKLHYLPPKISIEGQGIKRGLTAVEAAILMEQPLDKVMTMILFSVLKKDAAEVSKREPLEIKVADPLPGTLQTYETSFLEAFQQTAATARRRALQQMTIALVKSVSEKMKGFSRKETIAYYKDIMTRAWAQVEAADTPEVKSQRYDEYMGWTMLDQEYDNRTRRTFGDDPVFLPRWWWRFDPGVRPTVLTGGGATSSSPGGLGSGGASVSLPNLPGSSFASSIVGGVQSFASGVIGNITDFTSGVTNKTNPVPVSTSSRSGGGGGHSCACACACAGCACACAGGGR